MNERRLLMLESYHAQGSSKQMWRLTNPPGLPFYDNVDELAFVRPAHCRPAVIDEVSKIMALISTNDEW
ncbi:hypothetical protein A1O1_08704 [Capronia coronata CBS 617.96]|uniref:Uncharacterized protein n=1 Tax=Capronia coronata CBS 617.96 TaxID=1182541 RepID=W9XK24_9EURO|nr:uncharacterized protein A1O1_08704 [Capronia coronata CBS 617.96]EXJ80558.1 hypothetical protein A1O1_08704 [Capronia coronata CBS 617.96]